MSLRGITPLSVEVRLTADYAFTPPSDEEWGARVSTGRVQMLIHEMLQEQIALERSVQEYAQYINETLVMYERTLAAIDAWAASSSHAGTTANASGTF